MKKGNSKMVDSQAEPQDKSTTPTKAQQNARRLIKWAAFLSIGALVCHAIDTPDHLTEWWGFSAFFVTGAAFQFFYGFGLLLQPWRYDDTGELRENSNRYGRPYYIVGLVLAISIMFVYIITRTSGMPFFGEAAKAEPFTWLSVIPIIEDIPLTYCLFQLIRRT
jgi:hypothetical protein